MDKIKFITCENYSSMQPWKGRSLLLFSNAKLYWIPKTVVSEIYEQIILVENSVNILHNSSLKILNKTKQVTRNNLPWNFHGMIQQNMNKNEMEIWNDIRQGR